MYVFIFLFNIEHKMRHENEKDRERFLIVQHSQSTTSKRRRT